MISLGRLMTATPIPVAKDISFYQPTMRQILNMGEESYWSLLKIWNLSRKELIQTETPETQEMSDWEIWTNVMLYTPQLKQQLICSADCFLHAKIEFLPISNTIMIGEADSLVLLDEKMYNSIQENSRSFFELMVDPQEDQYHETENMSERERQIIQKMKESAAKLDKIKNGERKTKDQLINQVISLVAIGHYAFNEVYDMTIVQMILLLKKYVAVQQYELYTALSPYIDSKKGQGVSHWLDA